MKPPELTVSVNIDIAMAKGQSRPEAVRSAIQKAAKSIKRRPKPPTPSRPAPIKRGGGGSVPPFAPAGSPQL